MSLALDDLAAPERSVGFRGRPSAPRGQQRAESLLRELYENPRLTAARGNLQKRRFVGGPNGFVFGAATGANRAFPRKVRENVVLLAHGHKVDRPKGRRASSPRSVRRDSRISISTGTISGASAGAGTKHVDSVCLAHPNWAKIF